MTSLFQRSEGIKRILFSITLVLFICTQALAESSVWKIQKGESVLYLGGTCHLLRPSDYPLPAEFDKAYQAADILVFETDPGKLNDPLLQQKLLLKAMYDDGSTIDRHLSSKTYRLLSEYCASKGIPIATLSQFKPSIIIVMITVIELAKLGVTQEGVDVYFYQSAVRDKKAVAGLETADEQIQFLVGMGDGNEDAFVNHSIKDLKSIKQQYESVVDAWKNGDAQKLNELLVAELKTKAPKLYKELLVERNENWLPMIEAYEKTPRKEFILVGVAHLVGSDGIVEGLKRKGYRVEKL